MLYRAPCYEYHRAMRSFHSTSSVDEDGGSPGAVRDGWPIDDVLQGAAQALNSRRCRNTYLHDLRGGLQAIHSSLELLSRAARTGSLDPALLDKALSMAKRSTMNHERCLLDILDQLTVTEEEPGSIDVTALTEEVLSFLRSEAANRRIQISVVGAHDLHVQMPKTLLRRLLVDLVTRVIDESPEGASLGIHLVRAPLEACIEIRSGLIWAYPPNVDTLSGDPASVISRSQLVLAGATRWLSKAGGRYELPQNGTPPDGLRIYCPLSEGGGADRE